MNFEQETSSEVSSESEEEIKQDTRLFKDVYEVSS